MALTRITKGVIKPNENYDTHNINSTGIVTAIGLDVNGNGDISGNLSVGGILTYEDVTSIDSVGIITAQKDIHVGAGVSAVGIGTFGGLDINGDLDVDGHTNLDNVSVSGVSTFASNVSVTGQLTVGQIASPTKITAGNPTLRLVQNNNSLSNRGYIQFYYNTSNLSARISGKARNSANGQLHFDVEKDSTLTNILLVDDAGVDITGNITATGDLDVDGHTNLDNVSIAGITTTTDTIRIQGDNKYLTIGAGNDIGLVHTGGESFITNATGHLTHRCDVHKWENFAGSAEYFRIDSSGNVIVNNTTAAAGSYTYKLLASDNISSTEQTFGIQYPGVVTYGLNAESNSDFTIKKDGAERLRINSSGKVGIGTNNPTQALQVMGTILKTRSDSGIGLIYLQHDGSQNGQIVLNQSSGVTRTLLHSAGHSYFNGGNVGIGSLVPRGKLDIKFAGAPSFITFGADADNPKVEFFRSTGGSPSHYATEFQQVLGDFVISTAATANLGSHSYSEKLRIKSDGSVGIGSDNPHRKLVVGNNSDMAVIGGNAGIYLGTHPTGGFQNNAAIARAAANNYHISGSTPGDLCIASESGAAMIFGVSHAAGAMNTFLHVSRLRNFNYYGADYKFYIGSTETLSINSSRQVSIGNPPSSGQGSFNVKPSSGDEFFKVRDAGDFDGALNGVAVDIRNAANSTSKDLLVRSQNLILWQSGSEELRIDSAGRIGLNGTVPTASHANVTSSIFLKDSNTILSRTGNQYFALFQNLKFTASDQTRYLVDGYASAYVQNTGKHLFYTSVSGTQNTAATTNERFQIANDGAIKACHNGGSFGVGGTPINKFGITSTGNDFFGLHRSNATTGTGEFNINVEANSQVTFAIDDEGAFSLGTTTDPSAQSSYAEKFRIDNKGNLKTGTVPSALNFTDSNSGATRFIEIGSNQGDALLVTHASGYGVGYFGYERGGDRLVIACDGGGGNNKIDFITDAGTSTGGGTDNLSGKSPRMRITASGNIGINHDTSGASTNAPLTIKNSTNSSATRVNLVNSGSSQVESTQIYSQNNDLAFVANANEALRIKDTGTVEFKGGDQGTDALAVRSENGGASVLIGNFRGVTDTGDTGRLGVGKNNNALIFMNASGSQVDTFAIGNTDNVPLVFSTHNTERIRILGSGNMEMAQNIRLVSKLNSTWSAGVVFGGNGYGGSSTNASCAVTNGNFHIDARNGGYGMYLNWYAGNNGTYFGNGGGSQRGRIDGSGNLTLSGTYPGSDLRLKENIQNISGATDTIKSLVGKTFTWKAESGLDSYKHYGFIAQEVQKVVPDLVKAIGCHYFDKDDNLIDNIDPTESDEERESKGLTKSLTVNSEGVTPILVEAMKELIAKVETLEAEVASLKSS